MEKGRLLYEGKAKRVYEIPGQAHEVWMEFKDSLTAFNAQKKGSFENKGQVNCEIARLIFAELKKQGVASHYIENLSDHEMRVHKVNIIPLEVVVRNRVAGSLAKKMGITEGQVLKKPLVEFYYKNDELQDPFISDDQVLAFDLATDNEIQNLKTEAMKINKILISLFAEFGIDLVDFKVEFGKTHAGQILLADEITPDCMRLWDRATGEKLDKDRFRRDLGNIKESYELILQKLKSRETTSKEKTP